jgi:hypothetical protein
VAAWVSDIFYNFYLVKNHKIANNSTAAEAREKMSTFLKSLEFYNIFDAVLTKFLIFKFYLIKLGTNFKQQSYLMGKTCPLSSFL